jgi:hypothetical protein
MHLYNYRERLAHKNCSLYQFFNFSVKYDMKDDPAIVGNENVSGCKYLIYNHEFLYMNVT